jgi:hypothetical protein
MATFPRGERGTNGNLPLRGEGNKWQPSPKGRGGTNGNLPPRGEGGQMATSPEGERGTKKKPSPPRGGEGWVRGVARNSERGAP